MTYIVTSACLKCKFTDCVEVCPVDCFHEDKEMLLINAEVCVDCGACIYECPVDAIYPEEDVPASERTYTKFNIEKAPALPVISTMKAPLAPYPAAWLERKKKGSDQAP